MTAKFIDVATEEYPISFSEIRNRHPNVTVPHSASRLALLRLGYAKVSPTTPPSGDVVVEAPPVKDAQGLWYQQWDSRDFTQQELNDRRQASVPASVTMRQARLELLNRGLLASVESAIDSMPEPGQSAARVEWEYSQTVERDRAFVLQIGQALGMSQSDLDDMFIEAKAL